MASGVSTARRGGGGGNEMKRMHALVLAAGLTLAGAAAGLAVLPAPAAPGPPAGKAARNLVPNGDFEEGKGTPTGWQAVDGLTTFWVKDPDPRHGKVIKFDTDVYQKQGYEWWVKIARGARAKDAPRKV